MKPFLSALGVDNPDPDYLGAAIETLQTRSKTLLEMAEGALFYFQPEVVYEEKAAHKFFKPAALEPIRFLVAQLEAQRGFNDASIEAAFVQTMEKTGLKLGKIAQPVRVALTGKTVSPGIFEIIRVLGKEKTLARLRKAADTIAARGA